MTTKSHAELEKYHYEEIKTNNQYQLDGMMDCLREEMMLNMPYRSEPILPVLPAEQVIVHRHSNMSKMESDLLQQTARKVEHVSKTVKEHLNVKKSTIKGLYDSVE